MLVGRWLAFGAVSAWLLAGCADAGAQAELKDLRQRLVEQQQRTASDERKLDDLENRVFLLTDQVESQKVAALHRPSTVRLPVVRLKPADEDDGGDATPASTEVAPADDVSFEGAARSPDPEHTRPTLRIDGAQPVTHRLHETRLPRPDEAAPPPSPAENLGVAPAPPVPSAMRAPTPVAPSERSAPAVEPLTLYRTAYDDLRAGRHEEAERGFREFVRRFPHHDYADNAQYWLGECYYDQKQFDQAAPLFRAVVQRWPTGNKAPDALLKYGYTLLALGQVDKARATLREVPATYPHTEAARLATERLAQLTPTEGMK